MQFEQPATYLIVTQTSTYLVDTGVMRAYRETRPLPAAERLQRRLFTDGWPLVLVGVPEVEVGQPMRLRIAVPGKFLDRPEGDAGTPMVTTAVTTVSRLR